MEQSIFLRDAEKKEVAMTGLFRSFDVLIPREELLPQWAVIACDQFTSQPEYWEEVRALTAGRPSAYHCILPEAELAGVGQERFAQIRAQMASCLDGGIFRSFSDAFIYVERTLECGLVRQGLVGATDLERFDYHAGSVSAIRPTERTVEERIPPRQKVRSEALIELSHVLLLCDDPEMSLIEPLGEMKDRLPRVYDFDLMQGGGHIAGWLVAGEAAEALRAALAKYCERKAGEAAGQSPAKACCAEASDQDRANDSRAEATARAAAPIIYAVGDGNHSLAAAKANYERLKAIDPASPETLRARFAMVELNNIRSESMIFEPIHRILTGVDVEDLLAYLQKECGSAAAKPADPRKVSDDERGSAAECADPATSAVPRVTAPLTFVTASGETTVAIDISGGALPVQLVQSALDAYLAGRPGSIDYIHGADTVRSLVTGPGTAGLILPEIDKASLFPWIAANGPLPRKTFSLGHACEKRYYLEARRL